MNKKNIKVALVHDFLNQYGGAERVLEVLAEMFPEAPIYTLLYDEERMGGNFAKRQIHTSFLQKFPRILRRNAKWLLPLFPTAPEAFDLREFDLVISSSGAWSKGIVTRLNTIHIAYIHSPMRFVWDYNERYIKEERHERLGFFVRPMLSYFRLWDKLAADRPDFLIANSKYTQGRIKKYYRRESEVIYPPVKLIADSPLKEKSPRSGLSAGAGYFLIVSRLSAYKKIEATVRAFNQSGLPLVVAGGGKQEKYLRSIAKENVKILGQVSEEKRESLYSNARAFIFPGVDDFGLAPAESLAHGVPVLAIRRGGVKEIIEEGKNGEFFDTATPEAINETVQKFIGKEVSYDKEYIMKSVEKFSKERFVREMEEYIDSKISYDYRSPKNNKFLG